MGPAIQDLWMLLSGTVAMTRQIADVCALRDFMHARPRELQLIEPLAARCVS